MPKAELTSGGIDPRLGPFLATDLLNAAERDRLDDCGQVLDRTYFEPRVPHREIDQAVLGYRRD